MHGGYLAPTSVFFSLTSMTISLHLDLSAFLPHSRYLSWVYLHVRPMRVHISFRFAPGRHFTLGHPRTFVAGEHLLAAKPVLTAFAFASGYRRKQGC